MYDASLYILNKIEENGFKAYIVGGFVRDLILKRESFDVDINTNATPKDIKKIFPEICIPNEKYGSITVLYNKIRFEITTFRKENNYIDNRRPSEIEYVDDLLTDLKRRDFTINTICMDKDGKIIDLLDGIKDIESKTINTVGDSFLKFNEDSLRILRAIRFATILNFSLSDKVKDAIIKTKKNLSNISYNRKREELDKIFMSKNNKYGVSLLLELGLDKELDIYNLKNIKLSTDLIGIWASLEYSNKYPFNSNEKDLINKIHKVMDYDNLDNEVLYKYGPYVNSIAYFNKGYDKKEVLDKYDKLPIKSRIDLKIDSSDIIKTLNKKPGKYISELFNDIEKNILLGSLENDKDKLIEYILRKE